MSGIRIGQGIDVHEFTDGSVVVLGGVDVPHTHSLKAHSDGDVLVHALMDAILGALALGDIGHHFPDTDNQYKGANSRELLRHVFKLMREKGYRLGNADMTLVAQAPKMSPHIDRMVANICSDLNVDAAQVSVKATTTEKLGFTGRKEGIAAFAVVLLVSENSSNLGRSN